MGWRRICLTTSEPLGPDGCMIALFSRAFEVAVVALIFTALT
jgi:hypothetical protein